MTKPETETLLFILSADIAAALRTLARFYLFLSAISVSLSANFLLSLSLLLICAAEYHSNIPFSEAVETKSLFLGGIVSKSN